MSKNSVSRETAPPADTVVTTNVNTDDRIYTQQPSNPRTRFYRPHSRTLTPIIGPSMTKQSFKDETDITNILRKFQKTGIIEHINQHHPIYTDLPDMTDYQSSLHTIMEAEHAFSTLPAAVRDHFDNDPALFLGAFNDPSQRDQLIEWGLIQPTPAPRPADPQASSSEKEN